MPIRNYLIYVAALLLTASPSGFSKGLGQAQELPTNSHVSAICEPFMVADGYHSPLGPARDACVNNCVQTARACLQYCNPKEDSKFYDCRNACNNSYASCTTACGPSEEGPTKAN